MKKTALFLLLTLFSTVLSAQGLPELSFHTKDSLDGKPIYKGIVGGWIKVNSIYDFNGTSNLSALNLTTIPVGTARDSATPTLNVDLYQSRLKFGNIFQSKIGEIIAYVEGDFYGNNGGGFRLRHAFVSFWKVTVGQTWSALTDEDTWPNVADFDGPPTGVWVRQGLVKFTTEWDKGLRLTASLESPFTDYNRYPNFAPNLTTSNQNLPDAIVTFGKYWPKAHLRIGAVGRAISYKKDNETKYIPGYGLMVSGSFKIKRDKIIYEILGGQAIERYLVTFGGSNVDAHPDTLGNLHPIPIVGGFVSYQHQWGKSPLNSTILFGAVTLDQKLVTDLGNIFNGTYFAVNLFWNVISTMNIAGEYEYGFSKYINGDSGDANRIVVILEYYF